jgi:hypothetical protein
MDITRKVDITNEELIKFLEQSEIITKSFVDDSQYGFDLDLDSFMLRVYNLNPQRYGFRLQAYFTLMMGYEVIPSTQDLGDFRTIEGEPAELKCSFITQTNNIINVKQIRIWQKTKYYYILAVDFNDFRNITYECFKLSKREMQEEMIFCNATPSHSTKRRNEDNVNIEQSLVVKKGSETHKRWIENYKLENFDFRKICENKVKEKSYKEQLKNTIEELEIQLIIQFEKERQIQEEEEKQLDLFNIVREEKIETQEIPKQSFFREIPVINDIDFDIPSTKFLFPKFPKKENNVI